jgi:enamine deaminase RidA (YjgF/YER057c/UK114 family)
LQSEPHRCHIASSNWLRIMRNQEEIFVDNFPASALITIAGLARPDMLVEVQGIAVIR